MCVACAPQSEMQIPAQGKAACSSLCESVLPRPRTPSSAQGLETPSVKAARQGHHRRTSSGHRQPCGSTTSGPQVIPHKVFERSLVNVILMQEGNLLWVKSMSCCLICGGCCSTARKPAKTHLQLHYSGLGSRRMEGGSVGTLLRHLPVT